MSRLPYQTIFGVVTDFLGFIMNFFGFIMNLLDFVVDFLGFILNVNCFLIYPLLQRNLAGYSSKVITRLEGHTR